MGDMGEPASGRGVESGDRREACIQDLADPRGWGAREHLERPRNVDSVFVRFTSTRVATIVAMAVAFVSPAAASAAPGDRDPGFGKYGVTQLSDLQELTAVAPDESGGVFAVGADRSGHAAVVRVDSRGRLDPSFGDGGIVLLGGAIAKDVAVTAGGEPRILLLSGEEAQVVALSTSGSPVASFGAQGTATVSVGNPQDLNIDPAGRLLVSGTTAVARLTTAGELDPGFGGTGYVAAPADTHFAGAAMDSSGLLAVGMFKSTGFEDRRLLPDGSFDPAFGDGGAATLPYTVSDGRPATVAFDDAGQIYTAKYECYGLDWVCRPFVTRIGPYGELDSGSPLYDGGNGQRVAGTAIASDEMGRLWSAGPDVLSGPASPSPLTGSIAALDLDGALLPATAAHIYLRRRPTSLNDLALTPSGLVAVGAAGESGAILLARVSTGPGVADKDADGRAGLR